MGVFDVEIKIRNWLNRYLPEGERGEEVICKALVDSGAAELALPRELIERLRLAELGPVQVKTADGGRHEYRMDWHIAPVERRLVPNPLSPEGPLLTLMRLR